MKELVQEQNWALALTAASAMLGDPAPTLTTRRALHIIRLKAMLTVHCTLVARQSASDAAGADCSEDCPDDPDVALMRARLLRRFAVGSMVLHLARIAMASPAHFAAGLGLRSMSLSNAAALLRRCLSRETARRSIDFPPARLVALPARLSSATESKRPRT